MVGQPKLTLPCTVRAIKHDRTKNTGEGVVDRTAPGIWVAVLPQGAPIGITESWASIDITDAELGLTGYVMFRKDRIGRRGGGVILYVKESIQAYEIKTRKGSRLR